MSSSMSRWKNKVAIVTGASSGIGAAIAETLVEQGLQTVGLARRHHRLVDLSAKLDGKAGRLYPLKTDVTKEEDIIKAFEWTKKNVGPISILINNAGIVRKNCTLSEGRTSDWKATLDTNVMGLAIATREAYKNMKENKIDGHIVHMNSILGHSVPVGALPNTNFYPATKFAITALTETLRWELVKKGSRIKISSISPGIVATEGLQKFLTKEKLNELIKAQKVLYPKDVAEAVVYILSTPPHMQVHDLIIKPIGEMM